MDDKKSTNLETTAENSPEVLTDALDISTRKILKYLINNTGQCKTLLYLEDMLMNEDYIIFFYIKQFAEKGIYRLSRQSIDIALSTNAMFWIRNTSIYGNSHKNRQMYKVPTEYIEAKTDRETPLREPNDYARALQLMVLHRYDQISEVSVPAEYDDMAELFEGHKIMAQIPITIQLLTQAFNIINSKGNDKAYIKGVQYGHTEVLEYLKDSATAALEKFSGSIIQDNEDMNNRVSNIIQEMSGKTTYADPLFKWNLGLDILPAFLAGQTMIISAPEKEGKTRFALGEVIYPALCERKNVTYMSGEMDSSAIYATLVVKHLYASRGINLGSHKRFKKVLNIIIMMSKIVSKTITPAEKAVFDSYKRNEIELVLLAFRELLLSDEYGHLEVITANLNVKGGERGASAASHRFVIENLERDILGDLKKRKEGSRSDILVLDHAGHFVSGSGMSEVQVFRQVYQSGIRLAKNSVHPLGVIIINHLNTSQSEQITSLEDIDNIRLRAFGTSEAGKSADIDISLYSLPHQRKDGQTTLVVNNLRWEDIIEKLKTKVFIMSVSRGVCEFTSVSGIKKPYVRKTKANSSTERTPLDGKAITTDKGATVENVKAEDSTT